MTNLALALAGLYVLAILACLFGQWIEVKFRRQAREKQVAEFLKEAAEWDRQIRIFLNDVKQHMGSIDENTKIY